MIDDEAAGVASAAVSIQMAAAEAGLSERRLRYYEQKGLVRPTRDSLNHRMYGLEARAQLRRISELRRAGLPLVAIEAAQAMAADQGIDEARLWVVRQLLARRDAVRGAIRRIDDMVAELTVGLPARSNRDDL